MGIKGDKNTSHSNEVVDDLLDLLQDIGNISSKRMFGGNGLFHRDKMFGMVNSKGKIFLKVNDTLKGVFEEQGSEKHNRMPYYTIPESILKDKRKLCDWANKSIVASKESK